MKINVQTDALRGVLGRVQRVVERRNTIPILANVLITAKAGRLSVKATDLDLEMTDSIEADTELEGTTTVNAHLLTDIVKKLPAGGEAGIEVVDAQLKVKCGRSRFSLHVLPAADFPELTVREGDLKTKATMPASQLADLFRRVQFAISTEETRYYLNGIYLHVIKTGNEYHLTSVATDGHRLAKNRIVAPAGTEQMAGVIVPRKAVAEIIRLLVDVDGNAHLEIGETKIRVSTGNLVFTSKLIDGTFPDYARVIPNGNEHALRVDRDGLRMSVDRIATISSERGRAVKFDIEKTGLKLSANDPESGSAIEEIDGEFSGNPLSIGFNSRYVGDVISQLGSKSIEMRVQDPGSPALLQEVTEEGQVDPNVLYVLMPMRV